MSQSRGRRHQRAFGVVAAAFGIRGLSVNNA